MIKDKNIFECIFLKDQIYLPYYVCYGPPSHGMQRRKKLFKKFFPKIESSTLNKQSWFNMKKKHIDKRKVFQYIPEKQELNEVNIHTNAFGEVIFPGDKFEINESIYEIHNMKVENYVGLVCEYDNGKKANISSFRKDKDNIWKKEVNNGN